MYFKVYSAGTVLWKTLNFNDCKEAAADLQKVTIIFVTFAVSLAVW
jgi:Dolichol-phosphate mannosyltransferase subunit 3 (DPM3)